MFSAVGNGKMRVPCLPIETNIVDIFIAARGRRGHLGAFVNHVVLCKGDRSRSDGVIGSQPKAKATNELLGLSVRRALFLLD